MHRKENLYIGGQWVKPSGTGTIDVVNPTTGELLGSVPDALAADADAAVAAAAGALDAWSRTGIAERAGFLSKIHQGLVERSEEIARTITNEVGMPIKLSRRIQAGLPITVTLKLNCIIKMR